MNLLTHDIEKYKRATIEINFIVAQANVIVLNQKQHFGQDITGNEKAEFCERLFRCIPKNDTLGRLMLASACMIGIITDIFKFVSKRDKQC